MSVDINSSMLTEKALDYAKLSSLAYAEWIKQDGTWILKPNQPGYTVYDDLWRALYNKGYRVSDHYPNNPYTGYSGTIFEYQGKKILANRGTELDGSIWPPTFEVDTNDLQADLEIAAKATPGEQFKSMIEFITTSDCNLLANQFDVTGHSLGGLLAQMAKQVYGNSIDDVYTYNAPGALNLTKNYIKIEGCPNPGLVWVQHYDFFSKKIVTTVWNEEVWNVYETTYNSSVNYDTKVYNISAKAGISPIADWGDDVGLNVFVDGASHKIENVISSLETGKYYTVPMGTPLKY